MFLSEALTAPDEGAFRILAAADPGVLMEVRRPDVPLAIWQRPPPEPGVLRPLMRLAPFRVAVEDAAEDCALRLAAKLPAPLPPALLRDIRWLCVSFSVILGRKRLRARLEGITGDACRRFHADAVGLRLLCTYAGAGTEWLPLFGAEAARAHDPQGGPVPARLGTGDAAILKGDAYPAAPGRGLVHRSPPMDGVPGPRLLLCLDEAGRIPLHDL
ncbi:MAG: DUF1826 domain-containing protein [Azospirillum brasilense]|nr:MAG: DUF1826 domain-containing protein [Azospirillum brasilense]